MMNRNPAVTRTLSSTCRTFTSSKLVTSTTSSSSSASTIISLCLATSATTSNNIQQQRSFTSSTQSLLAFQSRTAPKNVVRTPASANSTSSDDGNPQVASGTSTSSSTSTPTASQIYPEIVAEWKRLLHEAHKCPTLELRDEFLNTFKTSDGKFDNLDEKIQSRKLVFDSPFVQILLYATAALFPLPEVTSVGTSFSRQDLVAACKKRKVSSSSSSSSSSDHQTGTNSNENNSAKEEKQVVAEEVPQIVFKAVDWIVVKRQQPQAHESATLTLDASIASYCLVRLGLLGSFSPALSHTFATGHGQIINTYNMNKNTTGASSSALVLNSTTGTEIARRLALHQRELRNLTAESLSLSVFTSGCIGRTAQPACEACLTKAGPLLNTSASSFSLFQLSTLAAFLFDPANFSALADRTVIALRKALLAKIEEVKTSSKTNIQQVAGTESAVIVSIVTSLLRDPCFVDGDIATDVLKQYCELFLANDQMIVSPRSALELIRAFAENLVDKSGASDVTPGKFAQISGVRLAISKFCDKVTDEELKRDQYCLCELFQYLSLNSMRNFEKVPEFESFSKRIIQLVETQVVDTFVSELSSKDASTHEAWAFADSLLAGFARIYVAVDGNNNNTSNEHNQKTENTSLDKLKNAYLENLLATTSSSSSSSSNTSNNANVMSTSTVASRIAALLKAPGMIQKPQVQRLITDWISPHSSSLGDILVVLEGLTSSSFAVSTHEARQIARSIAPVNQVSNASSNNNNTNTNNATSSSNPKEDLIRVSHCYGLLRVREESLCHAIITKAIQLREDLTAEELGVLVFAFARMDERNSKPYVDLAQRVRIVTPTASAAAATSIIVAFARAAAVWNYTMYFRLCERIVELRATWKRRDMLPLLVALARLEMRHERLIELITIEVLKTDPNDLSTDECTRFLSVLTHFTPNSPVAPKLGQILVSRQNELSAIQLGEVLASLGRAYSHYNDNNNNNEKKAAVVKPSEETKDGSGDNNDSVMMTPEQQAIRHVFDQLVLRTTMIAPNAPPMAIASILSGFGSLSYAHKEIFAVLGDRMLQIKNECPALVIGQVLHAFSSVGLRDDRLFVEMIPRVRFVAHHGSPQDVANVLTAYTTVQLWHYKLFVRLAERAITVRADCRPHHIAQILTAFAKVEMKYDKLFIELSPRIQVLSGSASAADVTAIIASYAAMNLYDATVFSQLADRAVQIASQFSGEESLKIIESFDKMSIKHEAVRKALNQKAEDEKLRKKEAVAGEEATTAEEEEPVVVAESDENENVTSASIVDDDEAVEEENKS